MQKALVIRIAIASLVMCASTVFVYADTLNATSCDSLFGLPAGTISTTASLQYLNPTSCAAYQFLLTRYVGGSQGTLGLANPQIQGITKLNPTFAVNLANLMHAADAAGYKLTIVSAYRTCAGQKAVNPAGYGGQPQQSPHTQGKAVDFQFPGGGAKDDCSSAAHNWVQANASKYQMGLYDSLHSYVSGECNHIESVVKTANPSCASPDMSADGGPAANPQPVTPGLSTPGIGATIAPGQTSTQVTQCEISAYPLQVVNVPAGTPYPSNCLNNGVPISNNSMQASCMGNTITYNFSGTITTGATCPSGCLNGACIQSQQCATGYTLINNVCTPQQCPSGYTMVNGLCNQTQQTSQPASTQSSGGTSQTSGNSGTTNPSTVTSPTIVSNLLTPSSTTAILQALANTQNSKTSATTTPIVLNSAVANNIAQLQANAPSGVTYAEPTSAYFPSSTSGQQSGSAPSTDQNSGGPNDAVGITTTPGTGYDMTNGTDTSTGVSPASSDIASTQAPGGADTFTPSDSGTNSNTQGSYDAASTFNTGPLAVLAALRADVISAINFLSVYIQPFGGSVPSQMGGE